MRPYDEATGRSPSVSTRPAELPRLLPAGFAAGPTSLAEHIRRYGPPRHPSWTGRAGRRSSTRWNGPG